MSNLFKREPALWLSLIQTVVSLGVGLGLTLTGEQVGLINGLAAAAIALVAALAVRPFPVPLLMGAIQASLAFGVGFGLDLSSEQVGLVNGAAAALVGFILRMHVSPASGPVAAGVKVENFTVRSDGDIEEIAARIAMRQRDNRG